MMRIENAYAVCGEIAKREAKNFYYAFLALPTPKRDAMYAIYAFMRRADDLSDDESMSIPERRVAMERWLGEWRASRAGAETESAEFIALRDTQKRFGISDELLEQLVQGTSLDIAETAKGVVHVDGADVYEDFDALYRYCYLVASVVGLTCIRVFGYSDPAAEKLAEETGIAFQLTNILRDVKEDAERGRVYLPMDMLAARGASVSQVLQGEGVKPVMSDVAANANAYYQSADKLIPLLDVDSRAAMWVLASIYRRLLKRIEASGFEVFAERISVPTSEKMRLLMQGLLMTLWNRMVKA